MDELRDLLDRKIEDLEEKTSHHHDEIEGVKAKQESFDITVINMSEDNSDKFRELAELAVLVKDHDKDIKQMIADLEKDRGDMERNVKDSVAGQVGDIRDLIDTKINEMDDITKDNAKNVDNLRDLNTKLIDKMKEQLKDDIEEHNKALKEHGFDIDVIKDNLKEMNDNLKDLASKEDVEGLVEAKGEMEVKMEALEVARTSLEEKVAQTETEVSQINQLVVNVQQDVGDVSSNLNKTRDSIKNLRKYLIYQTYYFPCGTVHIVRTHQGGSLNCIFLFSKNNVILHAGGGHQTACALNRRPLIVLGSDVSKLHTKYCVELTSRTLNRSKV